MHGFLRRDDLIMRLDGSLGLYKKHLVFIRVEPTYDNHLDEITISFINSTRKTIRASNPCLNVTDLPIGLINNNGGVFNLQIPRRSQKQGISNNTRVKLVEGSAKAPNLLSSALEEMLLNSYPTAKRALEILQNAERPAAVAISRTTYLVRHPDLPDIFDLKTATSGKSVGTFHTDVDKIRLITTSNPNLRHLCEKLVSRTENSNENAS